MFCTLSLPFDLSLALTDYMKRRNENITLPVSCFSTKRHLCMQNSSHSASPRDNRGLIFDPCSLIFDLTCPLLGSSDVVSRLLRGGNSRRKRRRLRRGTDRSRNCDFYGFDSHNRKLFCLSHNTRRKKSTSSLMIIRISDTFQMHQPNICSIVATSLPIKTLHTFGML